jgi:hypothetical protein
MNAKHDAAMKARTDKWESERIQSRLDRLAAQGVYESAAP